MHVASRTRVGLSDHLPPLVARWCIHSAAELCGRGVTCVLSICMGFLWLLLSLLRVGHRSDCVEDSACRCRCARGRVCGSCAFYEIASCVEPSCVVRACRTRRASLSVVDVGSCVDDS